jgi:putative ABC transport system substrate-binding protein
MRRRGFLIAVAALSAARASSAQPRRVWRIGFLYFGSKQSAEETGRYAAFLGGMREFGYTEGRNFAVEPRFADGDARRLPELAAALVRAKVDLIVASGTPANLAARKATATVPIVITLSVDPVADGLAASLARPGGNVTGLTTLSAELSQKHLEILSAVLPQLSRIGALLNPDNVGNVTQWQFLPGRPLGTLRSKCCARTRARPRRSRAAWRASRASAAKRWSSWATRFSSSKGARSRSW